MTTKKQNRFDARTLLSIIIGAAIAIPVALLATYYIGPVYSSYAYTNTVQYQNVSYTISQYWQQPDACIFGINYTNGTILWGEGWMPTRPDIANLFGDNPVNDYRWNLKDEAYAIYNQEWNETGGQAWACCIIACL